MTSRQIIESEMDKVDFEKHGNVLALDTCQTKSHF